jgi:esterase FrsA
MSFLVELKSLVFLHMQAQGVNVAEGKRLLAQIEYLDEGTPDSWVEVFLQAGDMHFAAQEYAKALHYYNLARFPFIDSPRKAFAYEQCKLAFLRWAEHAGIALERRSCPHAGVEVPYYLCRSSAEVRPWLIVIGGIVSVKEQWHSFCLLAKKLNYHLILLEMPGVGENPAIYQARAWTLFVDVIHSLPQRSHVEDIHLVAMSFGGHMAIQYALQTPSVRSITTVGAPIHDFFSRKRAWKKLPITTLKTLAHICKVPEAQLFATLRAFSLSSNQLHRLKTPLYYVYSQQDNIISVEEKQYLQEHCASLHLYSFNDVHGSPKHLSQIKMIMLLSLLSHSRTPLGFLKTLLTMLLKLRVCFYKIKPLD